MEANKQKKEQSAQEKLTPYFSEHGLMGFKNNKGEIVLPAQWKVHCGGFSEGHAPVEDATTDKVGFIDTTGRVVIPYQWDDAMCFSDGVAPVQDSNGKWGYIDKKGNLIVPCRWKNHPYLNRNGYAIVKDDENKCGVIDMKGNVVVSCKWNDVGWFGDNIFRVQDNNRWGLVDCAGKEIVPCCWMEIRELREGFSIMTDTDGKQYVIDSKGDIVFASRWKEIRLTSKVVQE